MMDHDNFISVYDEYAEAIYRHCFFRVSSEEQAQDLMQDTFLKTWNYLCNGNEVQNMRALLYRTANNLIIDYYRKKKSLSLDAILENAPDPAAESTTKMNERHEAAFVISCLSQLDEDCRQVITMRYVDELPVKEIASILEEKENTVSVRLHRGLKKARKLMTDGPQS